MMIVTGFPSTLSKSIGSSAMPMAMPSSLTPLHLPCGMAKAKALATWRANIKSAWPDVAIKDVQVQVNNGTETVPLSPELTQLKVGSELSVRALVKLGRINPDDISVELYYGPVDAWGEISSGSAVRMEYKGNSGYDSEHWFAGSMPCKTSGRQGLAVRVLPRHADLVSPYEPGLIIWDTTAAKSAGQVE